MQKPNVEAAAGVETGLSRIEWPTVALAIVIYGMWGLTIWFWRVIPLPLLAVLGGWAVAWQMSLQHEAIHGHPTRSRRINDALACWAPSLWLPYESYRRSHLAHHDDARLTDPLDDPESYYWTAEQWERLGPAGRVLIRAQSTLLGRMLIGPLWMILHFWTGLLRDAAQGIGDSRRVVVVHLARCVPIVIWVFGVCDVSVVTYLFAYVYCGTGFALIRSFAEHRAACAVERRTAIVENASLLGLLFLNNNLHAAHHARRGLAWYHLPAYYRAHRAELLQANGGLLYSGYFDVARRYLFRPHDLPLHPGLGAQVNPDQAA